MAQETPRARFKVVISGTAGPCGPPPEKLFYPTYHNCHTFCWVFPGDFYQVAFSCPNSHATPSAPVSPKEGDCKCNGSNSCRNNTSKVLIGRSVPVGICGCTHWFEFCRNKWRTLLGPSHSRKICSYVRVRQLSLCSQSRLLPRGVPPTPALAMPHIQSFPRACSSEGAHYI